MGDVSIEGRGSNEDGETYYYYMETVLTSLNCVVPT